LKTQSDLDRAANDYLARLNLRSRLGTAKLNSITRQGDKVTVLASNNIQGYFSKIFGKDKLDVIAHSEAIFDNRGLDLALVLDSTGSMSKNKKLVNLKLAATDLIEQLEDQENEHIRVSVVPFAQYVNIGPDNKTETWLSHPVQKGWSGCVGSRDAPYNTQAPFGGKVFTALSGVPCGLPLKPLSNDFKAAKKTISKMSASGSTYMPAGLAWGFRTLNGQAPFTEASKTSKEVLRTERVLVLMSDGENTQSIGQSILNSNGPYHNGRNLREADRQTSKLCEAVKSEGIQVFTIAYEINSSTTRKLLQNCATANVNFFDARNANDLRAAFNSIAQSLIQLRLTA
jgi:Mg-chelatase subunit ChlD